MVEEPPDDKIVRPLLRVGAKGEERRWPFFWQRNSSGVASSKGWTALCRVKCRANGFLSTKRSVSAEFMMADVFWPRSTKAVRAGSR